MSVASVDSGGGDRSIDSDATGGERVDGEFVPAPAEIDDSLRELCLVNGISETSLYRKPGGVQFLDCFQCHRMTMASVQYFHNLREIILIQLPKVTEIDGVQYCPLIERMWISECKVRRIENLHKCTKLRLLNLDSNVISRIENLGGCTSLETLWINNNRLTSLAGIEELPGLTTLWAAGNRIDCIGTTLDRSTSLTSLNLANNSIGYFKEIHNLARVPSLRHLCFHDPHFGDNPVCNLCNYQTYVLYQLPHVETLDTVSLSTDSKQLAEATYIKKKMYYNMRIKTLKRNTTNVIRRAAEALQARVGQINLSYNVLLRQVRDVERLMTASKWQDEHGRDVIGGYGTSQLGEGEDDAFWERLSVKSDALAAATQSKLRQLAAVEDRFQRLKDRLLGISEQNVTRMVVELGTGGNIRLEDGKPSDVWFTSCVDLLHSRFFHRDFLPIGVKGVKVNRVTRVHNRFLRNRFDQRMSHLMTSNPSLSLAVGAGDGVARPGRRSLEYLFYSPTVPALSSPTYASADLQRIAQEGFTTRHCTSQVPVQALPRSHWLADDTPSFAMHTKRFAKRVERERLQQDEQEEELFGDEDSGDGTGSGVLLSNSLSFADFPRLCESTAVAMHKTGRWKRSSSDAADRPAHVDMAGPEERPDVWLSRAGLDLDHTPTKLQLESMRRSAATGAGGGADGWSLSDACVSEGVIMIAKVFLGNCCALDTSGDPVEDGDGDEKVWHSACRPRSDDPKQRQWVVQDPALVLPEYIIDFEYEWESPLSSGSTAATPVSTPQTEMAALAEMSAGLAGKSSGDSAPVRLTPQAEADLRPLVRPLSKFVSQCRSESDASASHESDDDGTMAALDLPPVLRPPPKASEIASELLQGSLPEANPFSSLLYINLHGNAIAEIDGLDMCVNVKHLVLSFNEIQRIAGLSNLGHLEHLDLGFNLVKRVEGLDGQVGLKSLLLNNNLLYQLEDISTIQSCCPELHTLDLRNNGLCELKGYRPLVVRRLASLELFDGTHVARDARNGAAAGATAITDALILRHGRSGTGAHVAPAAGSAESKEHDMDAALTSIDDTWCDDIENLDLSHMRLCKMSNLGRLSRLRHLTLADNEISAIEGLESLHVLEELSLEENKISSLDGLSSLRFLKKLDLGKNRISKVENIGSLQQLSQLSLEDNELVSLEGLAALPALMELYIGNNRIESIKEVLHLKELPKLIILDLSGNPLCSHATYRLYTVYHLRRLKVLDGAGVDSSEQAAAKDKYSGRLTAEFLEEKIGHTYFEAIRELDLASCRIREVEALSGESFRCLSYLNLDHNQITGTGLAGLTDLPHLSVLRLNHNRISSLLPDHSAETLASVLAEEKGASAPRATVGALARLEVLQLGFNQISDIGLLGLERLPALKVLYLQGNDISRITGLETCHSLRELVLDKNRVKYLDAASFTGLTSLRELRMQENGLRSLSNVHHLVSLQVLALAYNRVADLPELDKLVSLPGLSELWLSNNPVSRKQLYRPGLVKRLSALRVLDGREITMEERERAELLFATEHRPSPVYVQDTRPVPGKVPVKLTAVNFESLTGYGSRGSAAQPSLGGPTTVGMALGTQLPPAIGDAQLVGRSAPGAPPVTHATTGRINAPSGRRGGPRTGAASPRYGRR